MTGRISPKRFHEADGVEEWRVLGEGVCAYFRTGSLAAGARLVQAIGELGGLDAHHPDIDLRHPGAAAIAAGGRLVTDEHAPMWWVPADPEGTRSTWPPG